MPPLIPLPSNRVCRALCLLAAGLMACAAQALPTDRDQPVQVNANSARFNQKTGILVYTGAVFAKQGTLEIRANEVTITTDKTGAIVSAVATGNPARYQQVIDPQKGLVNADANRIDYDARNEIITLTGNAHLRQQDGSSFQGSSIVYNNQKQQVDAAGDSNSRVQMILPPQPRNSTTKDKKK